jgi:hypothetical protein
VQKLNSATELIQRHQGGSPMQTMYYIGLDVHKRTISYCVKDGSGTIHAEGTHALSGDFVTQKRTCMSWQYWQ